MKLPVVFLAVAVGSALCIASAQTKTSAGITHTGEVYDPGLNAWVHGGTAITPPRSVVPPISTPSGSSRSMTVIQSFPFPAGWLYARDAAWDGSALWIGENYNSRLYKIDPVTGGVLSSFYGSASNPWGLAWTGSDLFSASTTRSGSSPGDTLPDEVFQLTTTGTVLNTWDTPDSPDANPNGAAYDPVTGHLWLTESYYNTIHETDPATGAVLSTFPFPGAEPRGLTWDGSYLYAIDGVAQSILTLDVTGTVIDTVSISALGGNAMGLAWDGQYFWVTENNTDTIYQVDLGLAPGVPYCFGDGVGTPCPCGNNNNGGGGGCDWGNLSFPEGGVLSALGTSSMAANNTYLVATGIENNFGIFFGANDAVNGGNGNPLNDGLRCAGGALVRLIPPTAATGNQATLPAPLQTLDTGAASGATRRYQYWFRTPNGPCATSANLTNGLEIAWTP